MKTGGRGELPSLPPRATSGETAIRQHLARARSLATGDGHGSILLRAVTGTGVVRGVAMIASFAVGVQLARALGATGYGYYGMALAIISVAGVPGEMGLPRLVTREVAVAGARHDNALLFGVLRWADSMSWRISALMMLLVVVADFIISGGTPSHLGLALLFGAPVIPLLTLARIRGGALQGLHHVVRGQIPDVLLRPMILSLLVLMVTMSGATFSPATAMALNSIGAAVVFVVAHVWLRNRLPPRPLQIARAGKKWLASSVPMGLTDGMRIVQAELSILLVGIIAAPFDAGLFRIANVTSFTAATPVAIINFVAFPVIARLHAQKEMLHLQRVLTRLAQLQFAGVLLLCLPLLLAPEILLELVFGAEYGEAATTLRILAGAQLITSAFGLNAALLNMTGHERRVTRAMIIALAINVVALPPMAALWGRVGAATAVAAALICWNVLTWWDAWRLLRLETSVLPNKWVRHVRATMREDSPHPNEPTPPSPKQPLVNLFIVGAPKCGTTAWYRYLSTHPDVFFSEVKEPGYFAFDLPGIRWWKSFSGYQRLFTGGAGKKVIAEASVMYLFSEAAARAIRDYNPEAKILIFLRDQQDFVPSLHHQFLYRFNESIEDPREAWHLSEERSGKNLPPLCHEPKALNYKAFGRFFEQVQRYYDAFPPQNVKVIHFDEWMTDPRATYLDILRFLGLPDDGRTTFERVNEAKLFRYKWLGKLIAYPPFWLELPMKLLRMVTGRAALGLGERASELIARPGYQTEISPEFRAEMRRYYEEDNRKLEKLLKRMRKQASKAAPDVDEVGLASADDGVGKRVGEP